MAAARGAWERGAGPSFCLFSPKGPFDFVVVSAPTYYGLLPLSYRLHRPPRSSAHKACNISLHLLTAKSTFFVFDALVFGRKRRDVVGKPSTLPTLSE